jgi:gluconate 2-dehydrogenase gamma chain
MTAELGDINRRALLQHLALLLGATALPHSALAATPRRKKPFLPLASFRLLTAIADTIIPVTDTPGAVAAGVPAKVDYMIAKWASAENRNGLTKALAAIDVLAKSQTQMAFVALTPARRKELLLVHDAAALKPVPRKPGANTGLSALMGGGASVADPDYSRLKSLIVANYYNSEIAMTQEIIYEHVPGGWIASIAVTPETRPFAGVGPF